MFYLFINTNKNNFKSLKPDWEHWEFSSFLMMDSLVAQNFLYPQVHLGPLKSKKRWISISLKNNPKTVLYISFNDFVLYRFYKYIELFCYAFVSLYFFSEISCYFYWYRSWEDLIQPISVAWFKTLFDCPKDSIQKH